MSRGLTNIASIYSSPDYHILIDMYLYAILIDM